MRTLDLGARVLSIAEDFSLCNEAAAVVWDAALTLVYYLQRRPGWQHRLRIASHRSAINPNFDRSFTQTWWLASVWWSWGVGREPSVARLLHSAQHR